MAEIRCELSWSSSRAKVHKACRRQYYYQYYGSWRGWERAAPQEARDAYRLKQMTALDLHAGTLVHQAIEHWFHRKGRGELLGTEELTSMALAGLDRAWKESQGTLWRTQPKRIARFFEHHYGPGAPPERAAEITAKIRACIQSFFEQAELEPVRGSDPRSWLAVEGLDTFPVAETKVYAVPDFAYRDGESIAVLDWKTGKPHEDDQRQLKIYALYASERWNADCERLRLQLVYLASRELLEVRVDARELEEVREDIAHSIEIMARDHFDPDVERVPASRFAANGAPQLCPRCSFQEICSRE